MKYHSHYSRELRTEVVVGEGEEEKEEQVEQVRLYSLYSLVKGGGSEYRAALKEDPHVAWNIIAFRDIILRIFYRRKNKKEAWAGRVERSHNAMSRAHV